MIATSCPCGSGSGYEECCGRYHRDGAQAPTAQALMRSRFSAFAGGDAAVEFAAHFEVAGRPGVQRERSSFVREHGRWFYVGAG